MTPTVPIQIRSFTKQAGYVGFVNLLPHPDVVTDDFKKERVE
jgi:hypothetical protein